MSFDRRDQSADLTTPLILKIEEKSKRITDCQCKEFSRRSSPSRKPARLILCFVFALVIATFFLARRESHSLASCLRDADVPFVVKGQKRWAEAIMPWNTRIAYTPAAVAIPRSVDQIQAAYSCGLKNKVLVSAKGGGHSFGSYGLGGEDGHLVLELEQMCAVTLHEDNLTATIQPGARLGHVSTELYNQGRRGIPHGACPGVGVAGHALLGGWGRVSRTHGLTLDWVIGAKVILANGSMVYCSETENPHLFWAMRGAGPSFGIVVEFEFNTFAVPDHVTAFTTYVPWNEEMAVETLEAVQELAMTATMDLNILTFVTATSQMIQGVYFGDGLGLNKTLQPMLTRLGVDASNMSTVGWLEGLDYYADGVPLDQTYPYHEQATYYTSGLMTRALTSGEIKTFMSTVFANIHDPSARHTWDIFFEFHGGPNSAAARVDPAATAYPHRDKMILYQYSDMGTADGDYPEEGFAVWEQFLNSITSSMAEKDWGMYPNFLDTQLDGQTAQKLYWADNLPRLKELKAELDPENLFWNPQGITP